MTTTKRDSKSDELSIEETLSIEELLDNTQEDEQQSVIDKKLKHYKCLKYVRMVVLLLIWLTFTVFLFATKTHTERFHGTVVPVGGKIWTMKESPNGDMITITLKGPFEALSNDIVGGKLLLHLPRLFADAPQYRLQMRVIRTFKNEGGNEQTEVVSQIMELSLRPPTEFDNLFAAHIQRQHILKVNVSDGSGDYAVKLTTQNVDRPVPLEIKTTPVAITTTGSKILSGLLIAGMFLLFFWDAVSRAIVVMFFSTLTIALLGLYHAREPLKDLLNHVDLNIILLIFGLTIIVSIFAETGGDLYLAVQLYRLSNGHIWPILTVMCVITAAGAAFLDSITILILMTSLAIRLCEVLQLNPTTVLTCLMLFSNTGYMLTRSGLPENSVLSQRGIIDYSNSFKSYFGFLLYMLFPVLLSLTLTYVYLRRHYDSTKEMRIDAPPIVSRLHNAINFWSRTAQGISGYTKEETVLRQNMLLKVQRLRQRLRRIGKMPVPPEDFRQNLQALREKHQIKDRVLLIKCCIVLFAVVAMQIAYTFRAHHLSPGWICILLALVVLALANFYDIEALMAKIDWSTLITVACLLLITKAIVPLGLMESIGKSTVDMITMLPPTFRLHVGCFIMLIMSTISSAFLDAEYVSYVMATNALHVAQELNYLNVGLDPLLLAIFLGTGYGANATLVSSIANIVCSGMAEKHGFRFYFYDFFKIGIVVTAFNILIGMLYLVFFNVIHVAQKGEN